MSNRGRFGKYGEIKRLERLRQAGFRTFPQNKPEKAAPAGAFCRGDVEKSRGSFVLRRAVRSDAGFIGGLSSRVFDLYGPYGEIVTRWFESGTAITFVAFVGQRPAGFAMIGRPSPSAQAGPVAELLAIAVEPHYQAMGVGRLLLRKMEETAVRIHIRRLFLHTATENTRARRLFTRCGYSAAEVKPGFYPAGQDAVLMFKDLP
ncbi:MAG: GNAT family N-acetyltransferase [Thermodesulfobacteriota bacterium]